MQQTGLQAIAQKSGRDHNIPLPILLGVIQVESGGNQWASRFEPHYRWCWNCRTNEPYTATPTQAQVGVAPGDFPRPRFGFYSNATTEFILQKTSFGPMQIMGAIAREHGYTGPLPALCQAHEGIEYGCRHLAQLAGRWLKAHGWAGVLDAYNDGTVRIERHPDYPDKIAATSPEAHALIYPDGTS